MARGRALDIYAEQQIALYSFTWPARNSRSQVCRFDYRADRHVVAALCLSKQAPEREYHEHVEQKP
jgi:hypothetical protein